jgi:hypothetical protein
LVRVLSRPHTWMYLLRPLLVGFYDRQAV